MFWAGTSLLIALTGSLFVGTPVFASDLGADAGKRVYLPLAFHAEGVPIRTSACLGLVEYPAENNFGGKAEALERVIVAFENKDREALFKLADPVNGRDPGRFDDQASAFFEQHDSLDFVGVRSAFAFNGMVLFFGELKYGNRSLLVPFVFSQHDDGSLGFLPYRTEALSYFLVKDWFELSSTPGSAVATKYCSPETVRGATHKIEVPSLGSNRLPLELLLRGEGIESLGQLSESAKRAMAALNSIKRALAAGSVSDAVMHMTSEGGGRWKSWWATATQPERDRYKRSVIEQEPFFLFDASPLMIVYTKGPNGVQVMYFTSSAGDDFVWTNKAHVTIVDRIFKGKELRAAAALEKPFSNIEIK